MRWGRYGRLRGRKPTFKELMHRGVDDPRFVPIPGPDIDAPPPVDPGPTYVYGIGTAIGSSTVNGIGPTITQGTGSVTDSVSTPRAFGQISLRTTGSISTGSTVNGFGEVTGDSYLLLMSGSGDRLLLVNGTDSLLLVGVDVPVETFTGYDGEPFTDYIGEYLTGV